MSFEAVLWATNDAPIANVNEFAVLTMLAEKADPDGCNAFPSRPTIAARTKIDPKTVLRCFQALEARGLIAEGDQRAAEYIRADRRPVVYDLLIPYSWFPNVERINKERQERGRPALTPEDRPRIAPAPEKKRRSDLGKKRPQKTAGDQAESARGDYQSPRDADGYGVTVSPARGDCQSGTGGLVVTRTSPLILSGNQSSLSPAGGQAQDARGARERKKIAPLEKPTSTATPRQQAAGPEPVVAELPEQREPSDKGAAAAAGRIVVAYAAALGKSADNGTLARLQGQAVVLLGRGLPEAWLCEQVRVMAASGWKDLIKHVDHPKVTTPPPSLESRGIPEWCGECAGGRDWAGEPMNPAARFNPKFRTLGEFGGGEKCPRCHPEHASAAV